MDTQALAGLIRWGISIAVPAASVLVGVIVGAALTGRRERNERRLAFAERQLRDFYSPMLGLRNEIRMRSELRERIHDTTDLVWRELCAEARESRGDALGQLSRTRGPEFTAVIEYDNARFREEIFPAYRQMATIFRENYWLAGPNSRSFYQQLIEFVDIWERWLARSLPPEVISRLGHSETVLGGFYHDLEREHDTLRDRVQAGKI